MLTYVCMCVCMYSQHFHQSMDQRGMVANPARGQLNRENVFFPGSPFAPKNMISRDRSGRPVPRPYAHSPHSKVNQLLTRGFSTAFRDGTHTYRQPPSIQSRVNRVTQLRTDGVHCQESARTGQVALEVIPVTVAFFSGITMDHF